MPETQYTPLRWIIQAFLMPIQFGMGLNFMSPTPLFTLIMSDHDIGRTLVSLLVSATIIVITIALIPGGVLITKMGSKRAMTIAGFLMSAHLLTPFLDSFELLLISRIVFGMGVAICIPTTSAITVEWFKPQERPLLNGINEGARALGVSVGLLLATPITSIIGWEMTLFSYALVPLVATVLWLIGGRSTVRDANPDNVFSLRDNVPLLLNRNTLLLAAGMAGGFSLFIGFSSWLPAYYHEAQGMTLAKAASMVAIMPLMSALFNPISGLVQAKFARRKPILIMSGLMFPLFGLGTFLMTGQTIITICVMGLGAMFSLFIVATLTIPMELPGVNANQVGLVTASVLTMGNLAGVLSPILVGSLADLTGSYIPGFSVLALAPLTLVIAGVFLPETGRRNRLDTSSPDTVD